MHESLKLFNDVVNTRWFAATNVILFLNKKDLFKEKLEAGKKLTTCFVEYDGEHTYKVHTNKQTYYYIFILHINFIYASFVNQVNSNHFNSIQIISIQL